MAAGDMPALPSGAHDSARAGQRPADLAFVLQLTPGSDPAAGRLAGRVQHLQTSDGGNFDSVEGLLDLIARVLDRSKP
jgi:hypothetical protein